MSTPTSLQSILKAFADVAEDLAIEMIAEFSENEMLHLDKTLVRLEKAEAIFVEYSVPIPFPVEQVLKLWRKRQKS